MNQAALMLPQDKANHVIWGNLAACMAVFLSPFVGAPAAVAAVSASFLVGLVKELVDWKFRTGKFDPVDLAVTAAAGVPVALLFL